MQDLWQNGAEKSFLKFIKFSFVAIANIKNSFYIVGAKDTFNLNNGKNTLKKKGKAWEIDLNILSFLHSKKT